MFKSININNWRQFEKVNINFHDRLTIITGANGAGKTTILKILSRYFGWDAAFIATPKNVNKDGTLEYSANAIDTNEGNIFNNVQKIGCITHKNGNKCDVFVPYKTNSLYSIKFQGSSNDSNGIFLPSHRPIYKYAQVDKIQTSVIKKQQAYNKYLQSIKRAYDINEMYGGERPTNIIKETLISFATFGYGNSVITPNKYALNVFKEFQHILTIVLPPKLGFEKFIIEIPELLLKTKTGIFPIDGVSGGIAAIIDLAWQIFMCNDNNKENFVVIIDEPENHLHPEMQRTLLKNFLKAFPNAQFIVSTHNPFIISSVLDSNIYVLNYNDNNAVVSTKLDFVNKAGTSNDILREVLGVPVTMPVWAEEKLNILIKKFSKYDINNENFNDLRNEMKKVGLEKYFPDTLVKVIEAGDKNDKIK